MTHTPFVVIIAHHHPRPRWTRIASPRRKREIRKAKRRINSLSCARITNNYRDSIFLFSSSVASHPPTCNIHSLYGYFLKIRFCVPAVTAADIGKVPCNRPITASKSSSSRRTSRRVVEEHELMTREKKKHPRPFPMEQ